MNTPPLTRPQPQIRSLRPSAFNRSGETLLRAVVATLVGAAKRREIAPDSLYPGDTAARTIQRAAVSPASLTAPEWAGALASTVVADYVAGLGPVSAAAALIAGSLQVQLGRSAGVRIPAVTNTALAAFVGENQPIPLRQFTIDAPTLKPRKLATVIGFSRETARSTAFEAICRQVLGESVGLALDLALFGADAETQSAPAGLRAGATSISPSAGGGDAALVSDVVNLAAATSGVAGDNIAFIASPGEAIKIALRPSAFPFPVYATAALPAGTLMAIAPAALATALDPLPEIDVSTEGVVHMSDTPSDIGTGTAPDAVVAAPTQSFFQTDAIGLRLIIGASWTLRAPAATAVAVITGATW